jgi:hypothetical protein
MFIDRETHIGTIEVRKKGGEGEELPIRKAIGFVAVDIHRWHGRFS